MSEPPATPPTSTPTVVPEAKPIPFKPRAFLETVDNTGSRPTSRIDCEAVGGHGGEKGERVYYPNPRFDPRTGETVKGPRVCEICGEVDV